MNRQTDKQPTISVIVAIYNVEKYIRESLDSLLAQTYKNLEILLIDDGSTDNSGKICDEHASKDDRIRVLHKPNGGVASARQLGLDQATGDYVIHYDPDDWAEPEMLEEMLAEAETGDYDIVSADYYSNKPNQPSEYHSNKPADNLEDFITLTAIGNFHCSQCKLLVKYSLIKNTQAYFEPDINFIEDTLFLYRLLSKGMPKIKHIAKAYYHYRVNPNSITQNLNISHLQQAEKVTRIATQIFNSKSASEAMSKLKVRLKYLNLCKLSHKQYRELLSISYSDICCSSLRVCDKTICIIAQFGLLRLAQFLIKTKRAIAFYIRKLFNLSEFFVESRPTL